jgi:hypothetical protein
MPAASLLSTTFRLMLNILPAIQNSLPSVHICCFPFYSICLYGISYPTLAFNKFKHFTDEDDSTCKTCQTVLPKQENKKQKWNMLHFVLTLIARHLKHFLHMQKSPVSHPTPTAWGSMQHIYTQHKPACNNSEQNHLLGAMIPLLPWSCIILGMCKNNLPIGQDENGITILLVRASVGGVLYTA